MKSRKVISEHITRVRDQAYTGCVEAVRRLTAHPLMWIRDTNVLFTVPRELNQTFDMIRRGIAMDWRAEAGHKDGD